MAASTKQLMNEISHKMAKIYSSDDLSLVCEISKLMKDLLEGSNNGFGNEIESNFNIVIDTGEFVTWGIESRTTLHRKVLASTNTGNPLRCVFGNIFNGRISTKVETDRWSLECFGESDRLAEIKISTDKDGHFAYAHYIRPYFADCNPLFTFSDNLSENEREDLSNVLIRMYDFLA